MLRRVFTPEASRLAAKLSVPSRRYTNYDHIKYPVYYQAHHCIVGYFFVMWFVFAGMGSLFKQRAEYKNNFLSVWKRKLGTGYQWSDAWGPQMDTVWRNVPDSVE